MIDDGTDRLEAPISFFGTGQGSIEVLLGQSPSYYSLRADREDFDDLLAVLVSAWREGRPVRAVIQGADIVSIEKA